MGSTILRATLQLVPVFPKTLKAFKGASQSSHCVAGDLVEEVKCIDEFTHPKTGRISKCFRIMYSRPFVGDVLLC